MKALPCIHCGERVIKASSMAQVVQQFDAAPVKGGPCELLIEPNRDLPLYDIRPGDKAKLDKSFGYRLHRCPEAK